MNNYRAHKLIILSVFLIILLLSLVPQRKELPSSRLEKIVTTDGNVERTDYKDENGNLVYASDKHYATMIKTTDGDTVLEEYFDAEGDPTEQTLGHYALLKYMNEDNRNNKSTYLDADGEVTENIYGYSTIVRTYNDIGKVETEHYFDKDGNPEITTYLAFGKYNEYDENQEVALSVYLDENEQPTMRNDGYAIIKRKIEKKEDGGKIQTDMYFDANWEPVKLSLGQYVTITVKDLSDRNIETTYLDANGNPAPVRDGYATIKRTFYEDGKTKTEMYFDAEGKPFALNHGQYGVRHDGTRNYYLDINGKDMFVLSNFLANNFFFVVIFAVFLIFFAVYATKKWLVVMLGMYVLFILYMTVMYRYSGEPVVKLQLFWSYRQFFSNRGLRYEILNNILLFMPMGAVLYRLYPKKRILIIAVVLSCLIETWQYISGLGYVELDDVLSNGGGALIGFMICKVLREDKRREYIELKVSTQKA